MFDELRSAYLFEPVFASVASGNEKGSVERQVSTVRSRAFVPVPKAVSFDELNDRLLELAMAHKAKVAERFAEDAGSFLPLSARSDANRTRIPREIEWRFRAKSNAHSDAIRMQSLERFS